ncbi:MAG: exodeoxyribonuclease VII large subunit [candidate division Zixibacteria bacterium]|nr:exodeoxyribonuclease VII large subunit [candidate division Zixibacteria bacterium]
MMSDKVISVTELTKSIKSLLEDNFPKIWVEGEISNYIKHSSGHRYFTLKDEGAQVKCVIWKGMSRYLTFEPENGMKVKASGQITVYERSGQYQLIVSAMQPAGIGDLEIAFQKLKAKLQEEGLFDESHKKPIPQYPERVGVVTSPTGAAIRDIIKVMSRRAPWVEIVIKPAAVQGETASVDIAQAITECNEYGQFDLLIVGRGGGSLEDLWPFNEEPTARAIFASKIPVISAVGHQIDFTISDFVADLRAPTPSAAAELAVPDGAELSGYFIDSYRHICQAQLENLESSSDSLRDLTSRYGLRKPMEIINFRMQRLDELRQSFKKTALHMVERFGNQISMSTARLEAASPTNIMGRGYAFVSSPESKEAIKSFTQIAVGDIVDVKLYKGGFKAGVTNVRGEK